MVLKTTNAAELRYSIVAPWRENLSTVFRLLSSFGRYNSQSLFAAVAVLFYRPMIISLPSASSSGDLRARTATRPSQTCPVVNLYGCCFGSLHSGNGTEFFNRERDEKNWCKERHGGQVFIEFHIAILYIVSIYVSFIKLFI